MVGVVGLEEIVNAVSDGIEKREGRADFGRGWKRVKRVSPICLTIRVV